MPLMKLAPALLQTALAALCLLPPCPGQEAATPALPPIFEHWQEVLVSQCTPEVLFYAGEDAIPENEREAMREEIESEVAEVEEHATEALEAAKALYRARAELLREAMQAPHNDLSPEAITNLFATGDKWLTDGFRRDLEALSFSGPLPKAGTVEPSTRPGQQEWLFCPPTNAFAFEQVDGCQAEISWRYEELNTEWREQQDRFMAHMLAQYQKNDDYVRDPFTGHLWADERLETCAPAVDAFRARMQQLIHREEEAWKRYREAMLALVGPCPSYCGSGLGISMSVCERSLLDTRERYLCLLAAGADGMDKLERLPQERAAAFLELHPLHRFGEVFTETAILFRHPKLEGQPWCLRFDSYEAGFIFVQDNDVLRRFASVHPSGGEATVRGCQSIEGNPPQQVFILQSYDSPQSR